MRVLLVSPYYDPAQMGLRLCSMLNRVTKHEAKNIAGMRTYFPTKSGEHRAMLDEVPDLLLEHKCETCNGSGREKPDMSCRVCHCHGRLAMPDVHERVAEMFAWADVLHFNQFDWTYYPGGESGDKGSDFCFNLNWEQHITPRHKLVFHGHGGAWLLDPDAQKKRSEKRGAAMVTCSPIDQVVVPGIHWMPNYVPVHDDVYAPVKRNFEGRLTASMASCAPLYKGGGIAAYVFEYLAKFGYKVSFEIIEGMGLVEALRHRAAHHMTVDNWTQGFHGLAGLEGLCLGHVVFSRFDSLTRRAWNEEFDEPIPIIDVHGMDDCARHVRFYHDDRDALKQKCAEGRAWMERHYNEEALARKWAAFYEAL